MTEFASASSDGGCGCAIRASPFDPMPQGANLCRRLPVQDQLGHAQAVADCRRISAESVGAAASISSVDGRQGTKVISAARMAAVVAAVSIPAVSMIANVYPAAAKPVTAAAETRW